MPDVAPYSSFARDFSVANGASKAAAAAAAEKYEPRIETSPLMLRDNNIKPSTSNNAIIVASKPFSWAVSFDFGVLCGVAGGRPLAGRAPQIARPPVHRLGSCPYLDLVKPAFGPGVTRFATRVTRFSLVQVGR